MTLRYHRIHGRCVKPSSNSTGATQVLHKSPKYEHSTYSKNSISRFGFDEEAEEVSELMV